MFKISYKNLHSHQQKGALQVALMVKNLPANTGDIRDVGSIPGSGRFPGGEQVNPLQYLAWRIP